MRLEGLYNKISTKLYLKSYHLFVQCLNAAHSQQYRRQQTQLSCCNQLNVPRRHQSCYDIPPTQDCTTPNYQCHTLPED